jgi:hypothetical protein
MVVQASTCELYGQYGFAVRRRAMCPTFARGDAPAGTLPNNRFTCLYPTR